MSGLVHLDQNVLNATQNSLCRAVNRRRTPANDVLVPDATPTVAVNVTMFPKLAGLEDEFKDVEVGSLLTVSVTLAEVLAEKFVVAA